MVWCASTEKFITASGVHQNLDSFVSGLDENDERIAPSMMYAYAALMEGVPFANGAPNLTVDIPALEKLAADKNVPICGKDFKTGQTLIKTVIAPMLKARMLGVDGWFSTNILGNRDGEVLDEPENFKTKEESKLGSLEYILQPHLYPDLYADAYHKIRIEYYPPRGDNKEAWDNIDIFGWLGRRMQIKINFLCSDSIAGGAAGARPGSFHGSREAGRAERHSGMAVFLLQEPATRARSLSRARPVHPADQAKEHTEMVDGRGADHAPRTGILP